jgi:hypothetical protein
LTRRVQQLGLIRKSYHQALAHHTSRQVHPCTRKRAMAAQRHFG